MAGRNDRRRSNDLHSSNSRTRQTARSAGTSRPSVSTQRARSTRTPRATKGSTASRPSVSAQRTSISSRVARTGDAASENSQSLRHAADSKRHVKPSVAQANVAASSPSKSRPSVASDRKAAPSLKVTKGGRSNQEQEQSQDNSTSVGELRRADRLKRSRKKTHSRLLRIVIAIGVVVVLLAGWAALYNSPAFTIENVVVNGVEHLTGDEMAQLANVPSDTTLMRVDTATIESRIKKNAWVDNVQVNRVFPNTLEINVTERPIFAVVEILTGSSATIKPWLIAEDHTWLMPVPDANSDAAKTTSSKVYEDAANALHIKDVPFGTKAAIGEVCSDANVNNALDILSGLTTELSDHVVSVSAAGTAETTLMLDNGVEVAFGKAEDIRDKERVVLQILNENKDNVSYINVRIVDAPTWRAV